MLFTYISILSLAVMVSSLFFAIISKRINLPVWYELIIWFFILGALGLILNNIFKPAYIENYNAEIILRSFGAILVCGGVVYAYRKNGEKS